MVEGKIFRIENSALRIKISILSAHVKGYEPIILNSESSIFNQTLSWRRKVDGAVKEEGVGDPLV